VENPQEVLRECLDKFSTPDYIMEPGIFTQLKRFVQINHIRAKSCCCGGDSEGISKHFVLFIMFK
jgi:hypothetical protein